MKFAISLLLLTFLTTPVQADQPVQCSEAPNARQAVMDYLSAMHKNQFGEAYQYVTSNMTDGRSQEEWSALQAKAYRPGKVQIYGVDVRTPYAADAKDPSCSASAIVPNILSSRDKLNEHGLVEFEIYTVVLKDGRWAVDAQETLFENADIDRWFPSTQ